MCYNNLYAAISTSDRFDMAMTARFEGTKSDIILSLNLGPVNFL